MKQALARTFLGTIRRQLILGVALVHAVLMVLFIGDLTLRHRRLILERQVEYATALSQTLAASAPEWIASRNVAGLQELIQSQRQYRGLAFAMILDDDGRVLAHTDPSRLGLFVTDLPSHPGQTLLSRDPHLVDAATPVMIRSVHVGWARVGLDQSASEAALWDLQKSGLFYALLAILAGSSLAWLLGSRLTRRLRAVQGTMDQVHAGATSVRVEMGGHDEVANLARGFNRMLEALEERAAQRDRATRELRESTQFLDAIIHTLPLTVFVKDAASLRYVALNRAGEALLGLRQEEVIGKGDEAFFPPEQAAAFQARDREVLEGRKLVDIEEEVLSRSGGPRRMHTLKVPILGEDGRARYLLGISQDITRQHQLEEERRQMEAEIQRHQRMESLGSLAGGVAHDMNNVIGAILGLASIHADRPEGDPRIRKDMATIVTACLRARTLVRGLLGFARQDLAERIPLDLNALVQEEVTLLERTTLGKVRIETRLASDLPSLMGDPAALSHALMNLCVNAVDSMPRGGTLTLRTFRGTDGSLRLEVEDTGEGMNPEVQARALDPFFTTKPQGKGTGLGLAIVYATVKAHEGTLSLASEPGRGTRITLTFPPPAGSPEAASGAADAGAAHPQARPLRILLVDDDELVRESSAVLLEALGHAVQAQAGGEAALTLLEAGAAYDAVILDLNMPGLGGEETLERLRALRPALPVFLATGRADQHAMDLAHRVPRTTLLPKPFTREELEARLEALP